jgi:hypothetical protein
MSATPKKNQDEIAWEKWRVSKDGQYCVRALEQVWHSLGYLNDAFMAGGKSRDGTVRALRGRLKAANRAMKDLKPCDYVRGSAAMMNRLEADVKRVKGGRR